MDNQIIEFFETNNRFLILCGNADEDSLSSGIVLSHILKAQNKEVTVVHYKPLRKKFNYIPCLTEIQIQDPTTIDYTVYDAVITVDAATLGQVMETEAAMHFSFPTNISSLCIDHHKGRDPYTNLTLLDTTATSTSIVVYKYIAKHFGYILDGNDATLVAIGIIGDTGFLRWNVQAETFAILSELVEKGAQIEYITTNYYFHKDTRLISFLTHMLPKIEFFPDIHFMLLVIRQKDVADLGMDLDTMSGFVGGFLHEYITRSFEGYECGGVLTEAEDGMVKGSFRGDHFLNKVDLTKLAKSVTDYGGGHFNAAGFRVLNAQIDDVKAKIIESFTKLYTEAAH